MELGNKVAVKNVDGVMFILFEQPAKMVRLEPPAMYDLISAMVGEIAGAKNPQAVSHAILNHYYKRTHGDDAAPEFNLSLETLRTTLTNRVALMLKSFEKQEPRPEHKVMASQIVDRCMTELR